MSAARHSAKSDGRWPPSRAGHLLPSGTFAECRGTRQSHLCRVLYFAECGTRQNIVLPSAPIKSTRQSLRHSAKSSFPVVAGGAAEQLLGAVVSKVTSEMNDLLCREFTGEEVKKALDTR